eukprot:564291-Rhodomonas_salina.2
MKSWRAASRSSIALRVSPALDHPEIKLKLETALYAIAGLDVAHACLRPWYAVSCTGHSFLKTSLYWYAMSVLDVSGAIAYLDAVAVPEIAYWRCYGSSVHVAYGWGVSVLDIASGIRYVRASPRIAFSYGHTPGQYAAYA